MEFGVCSGYRVAKTIDQEVVCGHFKCVCDVDNGIQTCNLFSRFNAVNVFTGKAYSRDDGDLKVTSGKEIYHQLSRGITLLKDGAISGNGRWAITLSYGIFPDGRKIQYWNLDEKKKVGALYCPQEIAHIHLSENGDWIFGETEEACWVLNVETRDAQWFDEHFISNQHSKLVTYGDWVFRKNASNDIYLFNLRTGEMKPVENRSKNARIATLITVIWRLSQTLRIEFISIAYDSHKPVETFSHICTSGDNEDLRHTGQIT